MSRKFTNADFSLADKAFSLGTTPKRAKLLACILRAANYGKSWLPVFRANYPKLGTAFASAVLLSPKEAQEQAQRLMAQGISLK